jgi:hypothetical protein
MSCAYQPLQYSVLPLHVYSEPHPGLPCKQASSSVHASDPAVGAAWRLHAKGVGGPSQLAENHCSAVAEGSCPPRCI